MKQLAIIAVATALATPLAHAGYTFTTGAEYTRGDYGTDVTTSSWYIPFSLGYTGKDYAVSVTVPYVTVSGSSEVTGVRSTSLPGKGGAKSLNTTTTSSTDRTDSGLGDVELKGSYQLQTETPDRPWMGVTGKIKLGTASRSDNLGTGENDYAVQLDLAKGPLDGFVGYLMLGDTNSVNYDDIFYGAIAYSMPLDQTWSMRAEYYTEQAALSGVDPASEINVAFGRRLNPTQNLRLYAIKGLSDSSPDWGAGVMLSTAF